MRPETVASYAKETDTSVCVCGPCARISVVRVRRGAIYSEMTGGVTVPRSILAVFRSSFSGTRPV